LKQFVKMLSMKTRLTIISLLSLSLILYTNATVTPPNPQAIFLQTMGDTLPAGKVAFTDLSAKILANNLDFFRLQIPVSEVTMIGTPLTQLIQTTVQNWHISNPPSSFASQKLYDAARFDFELAMKTTMVTRSQTLFNKYLAPVHNSMIPELKSLGFDVEVGTDKSILVKGATGLAADTQLGSLLNAFKDKYGTNFSLSPTTSIAKAEMLGSFNPIQNTIALSMDQFFLTNPADLKSTVYILQHEGNHARSLYNINNGIADLNAGRVTDSSFAARFGLKGGYNGGFDIAELNSFIINTIPKNAPGLGVNVRLPYFLEMAAKFAHADFELKATLGRGLINGTSQIVPTTDLAIQFPQLANAKGVAIVGQEGFVVMADVDINGVRTLPDGSQVNVNLKQEAIDFIKEGAGRNLYNLEWIEKRATFAAANAEITAAELSSFKTVVATGAAEVMKAMSSNTAANQQLFGARTGANIVSPAEVPFPNSTLGTEIEVTRGGDGTPQKVAAFRGQLAILGEAGVDPLTARSASGGPLAAEESAAMGKLDRMINTSERLPPEVVANLPPARTTRTATQKLAVQMDKQMKIAGAVGVPLMIVAGASAIKNGNVGEFIVSSAVGITVFAAIAYTVGAVASTASAPIIMGGILIAGTGLAVWETIHMIRAWNSNQVSPYADKTAGQIFSMVVGEIKNIFSLGTNIVATEPLCLADCVPYKLNIPITEAQRIAQAKIAELEQNPDRVRTPQELEALQDAVKFAYFQVDEHGVLANQVWNQYETNRTSENLLQLQYAVETYKMYYETAARWNALVEKAVAKNAELSIGAFYDPYGNKISLQDWIGYSAIDATGFEAGLIGYNMNYRVSKTPSATAPLTAANAAKYIGQPGGPDSGLESTPGQIVEMDPISGTIGVSGEQTYNYFTNALVNGNFLNTAENFSLLGLYDDSKAFYDQGLAAAFFNGDLNAATTAFNGLGALGLRDVLAADPNSLFNGNSTTGTGSGLDTVTGNIVSQEKVQSYLKASNQINASTGSKYIQLPQRLGGLKIGTK
jgi:hypothetical protein